MDFRTIVDIPAPGFSIQPAEPMLFVGSCFADNLGKRFAGEHFPVVANPYGVMYNPASILHTVERFVSGQETGSERFVPSTAMLTLGTNHVYIEKATDEIVDNCRKRPQNLFREEILTVGQCADYLRKAIGRLHEYNAGMNIVVTVSPIRYRKYGYHGSRLSKAVLLLAADTVGREGGVYYFPAYEIMNDELRDYRFYQPDMLHPSPQAVEYIFGRFVETCFSAAAREYLDEWRPIRDALNHHPFNPDSDEYKVFRRRTEEKLKAFDIKYNISRPSPQ